LKLDHKTVCHPSSERKFLCCPYVCVLCMSRIFSFPSVVLPPLELRYFQYISSMIVVWSFEYDVYASTRHISSPEDRITSIKHCAPRISSKMATIDEFALKNIILWWRYGISRHCDEWKYIIIGRIFESEIILMPPSLKISESSSNRNTDEVWWRYGISRSYDEWRKHMTPFYRQQKLPDNREYIKIQEWPLKQSYVQRNI
jgi:hypothetical protein